MVGVLVQFTQHHWLNSLRSSDFKNFVCKSFFLTQVDETLSEGEDDNAINKLGEVKTMVLYKHLFLI